MGGTSPSWWFAGTLSSLMLVGVVKSLATEGGKVIIYCFSVLCNLRF